MKLSHLSLAIFSAIALAACGGSSSGDQTTPDPKPDPKPKPEDKIKDEDKIVDPAQTGVVGNLNFKTESSVGTTQYIRGDKSKYDRVDNPKEPTSATSILGVSVNEQNPYLTNFALARLKDKKNPKQTLVQYFGNPENMPSDLLYRLSLQQQNRFNVQLDENQLTGNGTNSAVSITQLDAQIQQIDGLIAAYEANPTTPPLITPTQKAELATLKKAKSQLEAIKELIDQDPEYGQNRLPLLWDSTAYAWGDGISTDGTILDGSATVGGTPAPNLGPAAIGLVSINYNTNGIGSDVAYKDLRIRGLEKNSKSSTRIFGRNFDTNGSTTNWNSYLGASTFVPDSEITDFAKGAASDRSNVSAEFVKATRKEAKWELGAIPSKLEYVQYGRVTGNLDPVNFTDAEIKSGEEFVYRQMNYLNHQDPNAVDTYFYRGPDATTVAQMKGVAAGGQVLTYRGHALMYGIDNEFHNKNPGSVPTAFGKTSKHGIGNFVRATVDLEKGRLDDGFVYNVWQQDNDQGTVEDPLVRFDGNIFGNTVIGEAQRVYDTSDKADFRASFFGKNADELGGSFNSTTWQERYGAKGDAWGGVFGAKRAVITSDLSNQQLGDIPPLTQPKAAEETPEG